jgi:type I restriction enzyme S subunit
LYYHYLFRTPAFMCESYRNSYGICDDQLSLRYEDFKTIRIPVPPVAEQSQIAQFVQKVDTQTDRLIGRIRLQIEFLQEYRTRLVADVVTGKLDVRDVELLDVDVMEGFDERYEEERLEQEEMMEAEEMDVDENN